MQYFKELNLPNTPLKDNVIDELYHLKELSLAPKGLPAGGNYQTVHYDIEQFINQDLLDVLASVNLQPLFFVHFGSLHTPYGVSSLHSDLYRENNVWVPVAAGINWDLTPGTTDFKWYDASALTTEPMPSNPSVTLPDFGGNHYGKRFNKDTTGCIELAHLSLQRNTPYLLKTDIPHQITYTSDVDTRVGISLRFHNKDIPSWEHALEIFAPLFGSASGTRTQLVID